MQAIIQNKEKVKYLHLSQCDFDQFQKQISYAFGISTQYQVIKYISNEQQCLVENQQTFEEIFQQQNKQNMFQIAKNDLQFSLREVFNMTNQEICKEVQKINDDFDITFDKSLQQHKSLNDQQNNIKNKENLKVMCKKLDELSDTIFEQSSYLKKYIDKSSMCFNKGYQCNNCNKQNFSGIRYECMECSNFNLCSYCEDFVQHDHDMFLINKKNQKTEQMRKIQTLLQQKNNLEFKQIFLSQLFRAKLSQKFLIEFCDQNQTLSNDQFVDKLLNLF